MAIFSVSSRLPRMVIIGISVINISIFIMVVFSLLHIYWDVQERVKTSAGNIAYILAQQIGSIVDRVDLVLKTITDLEKYEVPQAPSINESIGEAMSRIDDIDNIGITDADGQVVKLTGIELQSPINLSDRDYFKALRSAPTSGLVITKPVFGKVTGKKQILFVRRYNHADGSFGGVVYAVLTTERIVKMFMGLDIGLRGVIGLMGIDSSLIAQYARSDQHDDAAFIGKAQEEIGDHLNDGVMRCDRGTIAYKKIGAYPYYISVGLSDDDYFNEFRESLVQAACFVVLLVVVTLSMIYLIRRSQNYFSRYMNDIAQKNDALRASEARYRGLVESQGDFVVRIDKSGAFGFTNQSFATALGRTVAEVVGERWQTFVHPDDVGPTSLALEAIAHGRSTRAFVENRILETVGVRWIAWEGCGISDGERHITEIQAVGRDVTERKKMADDLQKEKEKAEAANAAKSMFLAMMSHEFRTPLNLIMGFAETIRHQEAGPVGAQEYIEYADCIHSSGWHLLNLINDILDLSKIESGKMSVEPTALPVNNVLSDCFRYFRMKLEMHGLTLTISVAEPGLEMWADERAVRQILFNLLSNAIKFTPRGGTILASAQRADDGGVCLTISDTGVGIPGEELARVLRPFEQLDNRFSRACGGTGLGLPLVQGLVGLHGGRLEIASTLGKGSTFTVWLPPRPNPGPSA